MLGSTLRSLASRPDHWDVVVIDDGSRDRTAEIARDADVRCVSLPMNLGIGTAVQTGYRIACEEDYDWALQFDADGQHLAEEIPKLVTALDNDPALACVIGSRYLEPGFSNSAPRRIGAHWFAFLLRLMGCPDTTDPSSGFRLSDRRAIAFFGERYPLDYPEVEARLLLHRRQLRVKEVPVRMAPRQGGHSSIGSLDAGFYFLRVSLSLVLSGGR